MRRLDVLSEAPSGSGSEREARDRELAGAGWARRFSGAPPRVSEMGELYEALGWEVLLDELRPEELPDGCDDCRQALSTSRVLYTRRPLDRAPKPGGAA